MKRIILLCILSSYLSIIGLAQTANDIVPANTDVFRWGTNPGWGSGWANTELADLAAGNDTAGIPGAGCNTLRVSLPHSHLERFGYEISLGNYNYYNQLGLESLTAFVGSVADFARSNEYFCEDHRALVWRNMYTPIWDNGENGTPVNDSNYFAAFLYSAVSVYGDYVKYWEIINEPDFTYSPHGWELASSPGSWYNVDPDPCDLTNLYAPIEYYIRLLRISYEVIKSLQPNDYVCLGGIGYNSFLDALLRNTDEPTNGDITAEYPLLGGAYFDCVSFHKYPMYALSNWNSVTEQWDYTRHSDAAVDNVVEVIDNYQGTLAQYGYDGITYPKKVQIITETNIPREPIEEYIGSDDAQYNYLSKIYIKAQQKGLHQVHTYCLWDDPDGFENYSVMGYYEYLRGVEYGNQVEHSSAIANRTQTMLLSGYEYSYEYTEALNLPDEIDGVVFKRNDSLRIALWAKTQNDMSEWSRQYYYIPSFTGESSQMRMYDWRYGRSGTYEDAPIDLVQLGSTPKIFEFLDSDSTISIQLEESCFYDGTVDSTVSGSYRGASLVIDPNPESSLTLFFTAKNAATEEMKIRYRNTGNAAYRCQLELNGSVLYSNLYLPVTDEFEDWSLVTINMDVVQGMNGIKITSLSSDNSVAFDELETSFNIVQSSCEYSVDIQINSNSYVPEVSENDIWGTNVEKNADWTDLDYASLLSQTQCSAVRQNMRHAELSEDGYNSKTELLNFYQNNNIKTIIAELGGVAPEVQSDDMICADQSLLWQNMYSDIWDNGENGTPINDTNYFAEYVYKTVNMYGHLIDVWEILPEPDKTNDITVANNQWFESAPDPCELINISAPIEQYIRALHIAYEIIKYKDSTDFVCVGGVNSPSFIDVLLRTTENPEDGSISDLYNLTGGAFFDCYSINSYPGIDTEINNSDDAINYTFEKLSIFDSVLNAHGYNGNIYPKKRAYLAKTNVSRQTIGSMFGSSDLQKNYVSKLNVVGMTTNIISNVFTTNIVDLALEPTSNPVDLMGYYLDNQAITLGEETETDALIASNTVIELLSGYVYSSMLTSELYLPDSVHGYVFTRSDTTRIVLWAETNSTEMENIQLLYTLPSIFTNSDLNIYSWDYSQSGEFENGTQEILLDANVRIVEVVGIIEPITSVIQCEDASGYIGIIGSSLGGYYGNGYLSINQYITGYATIEMYSILPGRKTISLRYNNYSDDSHAAEINVNDSVQISMLNFESSQGWQEWDEIEFTVDFVEGYNSFTIKAITNSGLPNFDQITVSGEVYLYSLGEQYIELTDGWNLVSLYLLPDNNNVAELFPNAEIVKTDSIYYYNTNPSNLNLLSIIEEDKAYLVYNNETETLTISGVNINVEMESVDNGWNMIGIPVNYELNVAELPNDIILVKDFDAFYERGTDNGTLQLLLPGKAYFMYK